MSTTSGPESGSGFSQRIELKAREQAEIFERVFREALTRLETPVRDSTGRLKSGLDTSLRGMEERLSRFRTDTDTALARHTEKIKASLAASEEEADARLERLEKRSRGPLRRWTAPFLLGTALTLLVQAAGFWLAGGRLIWPQLEIQALNRTGLSVQAASDGGRWIMFPAGTAFFDDGIPESSMRRTVSELRFLIPDGS